MKSIQVTTATTRYEIQVAWDRLRELGSWLANVRPPGRIAVLSDDQVWGAHGAKAEASLREAGFDLKIIIRPPGEGQKALGVASEIYDELVEARLDRKSALIAFGGGVVGDLGGFVAATFLRGIPFVQVPTTLLAQVDSSVGGKVGINHPKGKNLIGAFYQPVGVLIDPSVLRTLPEADFASGMAEVIKHGIIRDARLHEYLRQRRDAIRALSSEELEHIIAVSCEIKGGVVSEDEKEGGLRAILNYGHTVGHAIEAAEGYGNLRHGECVSLGMIAAARISEHLGLASPGLAAEHREVLASYGLPTRCEVRDPGEILAIMHRDKKVLRGKLRFVLASSIGEVQVCDEVTDGLVEEVLKEMGGPVEPT